MNAPSYRIVWDAVVFRRRCLEDYNCTPVGDIKCRVWVRAAASAADVT